MNRTTIIARGLSLIVVALIITGCASPTPASTAAPIPTTGPLACPTNEPLSCPTAMAQVPPTQNAWRIGMNDNANLIFTFDPGDKCSMDVKQSVGSAEWAYEIVVNDEVYQNYMVAVFTLDEGKTLKDLQDYDNKYPVGNDMPPFAQLKMYEIVEPLSSTFHGVSFSGSPVYFVCLVQGPEDQKVIDEFGPVKVID